MPFDKPYTLHTNTILLVPKLEEWTDLLTQMGVPAFDISDPPWKDGYEAVTPNGKLFTRVEKWMYDTHKIKLYTEDKRYLSNALSQCLVPSGFTAGIDNDFMWMPGFFGDSKSCFYGGKRQAWQYIKKLGGAALKVYKPDGTGLARCLILPHKDGHPILFNSYGYPLLSMAAIYCAVWQAEKEDEGYDIRWVGLTVDGHANLPVHINDAGGYAIGSSNDDHTDISAAALFDTHYGYHKLCELCGERLWHESSGYINRGSKHEAAVCTECGDNNDFGEGSRFVGISVLEYTRYANVPQERRTHAEAPHLRGEERATFRASPVDPPGWLPHTWAVPVAPNARTEAATYLDRWAGGNLQSLTREISSAYNALIRTGSVGLVVPVIPEAVPMYMTIHQASVWLNIHHTHGSPLADKYLVGLSHVMGVIVTTPLMGVSDWADEKVRDVCQSLYLSTRWRLASTNTPRSLLADNQYTADVISALLQGWPRQSLSINHLNMYDKGKVAIKYCVGGVDAAEELLTFMERERA